MKSTLLATIVTLTLLCRVWLSMPPLAADGKGGRRAVRPVRHRDIAYGTHRSQRLDIYVPPGTGPFPVMVYIHGGGWQIGDKRGVQKKPAYFSGQGWVFVSINYRLLPEGRHPANVSDVAAAIVWVHDHIRRYGGDPDALFIMGHSAGAHLAGLVATDERYLKQAGKSLSVIRGVVALDTQAWDIPELIDRPSPAPTYVRVFGDDPDVQRDASPITHVAADRDIPPFLICYTRGMRRTTNPRRRQQAEAFAAALRKAGVEARTVDATDRNHGDINRRLGSPEDERVTGAMQTFLDALLEQSPNDRSSDNS